jgi:outer membrane protein OmpU
VSGSAEMGIIGGDNITTQFMQSVDVRFAMTGTADNGLSFGATVDLDDSQDTAVAGRDTVDSTTFSDFTVFISGELGTLTMGDTDGALDWAMQEVNIGSPGSINDDETAHAGYNGNSALDGHYDGQVLRYDYSFGDFSVAVSIEQDDDSSAVGNAFGGTIVNNGAVTSSPVLAIGGRYTGSFTGGTFGVGIGYQYTADGYDIDPLGAVAPPADPFDDSVSVIGVSAHVALDMGFSAAINYSELDADLENDARDFGINHFGIGASYTFDAITLHANYGEYDVSSAVSAAFGIGDSSGFGLAAAYDFGGGLSAHLGYGNSQRDGAPDSDTYSLGLAMSF